MSQLEDFVRGATRVLEIGSGAGDQTLAIARALAPGGRLIALEPNQQLAHAVRERIASAGLADRAVIMVGLPARFLHKIAGPFDVIVATETAATERDALGPRLLALLRDGGRLITRDDLNATVNV